MSAVWWSTGWGIVGYLGNAPRDGLQWERHRPFCKPGLWLVSVTGWAPMQADAVVDDFGDLVQVAA